MCSENDLPLAQTSPLIRRMRVTNGGRGPPPSETFSYEREPRLVRKYESPSSKGSGNDAMKRVLDQISRSPFMYRIEGAKLPRRFNQPAFAIYNGQADPVEHVSQFNQKMAIFSQNEALMCKIFQSSLGPMAMRWFNSLKTNSIGSYKQLRLFAPALLQTPESLDPSVRYCPYPCTRERP